MKKAAILASALALCGATVTAAENEIESLRLTVEELRATVEILKARLDRQDELIRGLRTAARGEAPAGTSVAEAAGAPAAAPTDTEMAELERQIARELGAAPTADTAGAGRGPEGRAGETWSPARPITIVRGSRGYANLSLDTIASVGTSTARDVGSLQGGGHDPNQRGFTLQNLEVVLDGAVDPYFKGQANLIMFINEEGETVVELEEAYLTSTSLPANLQLKAGTFFSEFGRLNPTHPHSWDFVDQPLVNNRFFGPDGLRGPGARVSWLMPTPFYSEAFLAVQNSQGETAVSFRGEPDEAFAGRPIEERPVRTGKDMLILPRLAASFDLSDTQTILAGVSGAFGPNGTSQEARTSLYGADFFWKWKPVDAMAGFPFVKWQTEAMLRRSEAGAAEIDTDDDGLADLRLPREFLEDWGAYTQLLWGVRPRWVVGLRGEIVRADEGAFGADPDRPDRWRISPNVTWYPSEFSKFRLQFNHDRLAGSGSEQSLWLQMEFLLGAHAAHAF